VSLSLDASLPVYVQDVWPFHHLHTDFHRFHQNPPSSPLSTTIQTPITPNALVITARINTGSTFSIFRTDHPLVIKIVFIPRKTPIERDERCRKTRCTPP